MPKQEKQARVAVAEIAAELGITKRSTRRRAINEGWLHVEEAARGGRRRLYSIDSLPADVREAVTRRLILSAPVSAAPVHPTPSHRAPATSVAVSPSAALTDLTDWQRQAGAARAAIVAEAQRIGEAVGIDRAIRNLIVMAGAGGLPEQLQQLVPLANAKRGQAGKRTLSRRTLYRWIDIAKRGPGALAPAAVGRDYTLAEDVAAVLALSRQPNKPSLAWCAKEIARAQGVDAMPLYHRAKRYMKKLPKSLFYAGRHTGAALNALRPFRRREFLSLAPNDVWVGDGHGAKLKVAHPITGAPFVPEVTAILDVATRYCVGWSVALSENCLAVADAMRHAVSRHGVPLIYYSDNGGGQTNKMFDAPITGTLGALGIHHELGRPGNPQGRGVIERFWQTTLIPLARRFDTFRGASADRETLRKVTIEIDRALRAVKKGEVTALPRRLPTWQQFLDALVESIDEYNNEHQHRSLPKLDGARHATPQAYRIARITESGTQLLLPKGAELDTLFMPAITRRANRGEVRAFNGIYSHKDLMLVDGEEVQVCYDIHDASRVWVKKLSGESIACAVLDGNRDDYQPKPLIERLADQRTARRAKRLQGQLDEVHAERAGLVEQRQGEALEPLEIVAAEEPEQNVVALSAHGQHRRPLFDSDVEKFRWLMEHAGEVNTEDENWLGWYRATSEWADLFGDESEVAAR